MGDRAVLVGCADLDEVLALAATLRRAPVPGQLDLQPAERSLLVVLDDARRQVRAAEVVATLRPTEVERDARRSVVLDVVYDGDDLDDVAVLTGTSRDAVVAAHSGTAWRAAFAGFAPGFVYLVGDLPPVPRRDVPRTAVPAGAVAVGGPYSAVYPRRSPGGWQLLGRTDATLWDAAAEPPALLQPGDDVRFHVVRAVSTGATGPTARPVATGGTPGPSASPSRGTTAGQEPCAAEAGATFTVLAPGPLTLVEDLGRPGRRDVGVSPGGAADRGAARLANRLVGNARGEAVLETVLGGLTLRAHGPAVVALTGASGHLDLEGPAGLRRLPAGGPAMVWPGETLAVPAPASGLRSYLAVRGGVDVPQVLGSRSSDVLAGLGPAPLAAGDVLVVGTPVGDAVADAVALAAPPAGDVTVRAVRGPDAEVGGAERLWGVTWTVADASDRVGLRLTGGRLGSYGGGGRPSSGVVAGAVQVPPSGEPVVFLVDHPVTGGYPVVAVVVDADRDALAQLRPGQGLRLVPYQGAGLRVDTAPALADPEEARVEHPAGLDPGSPMTHPTPDFVISGVPFPVRQVDGRTPQSLEDFVDEATLVLEDRSGERTVVGEGHLEGDQVRFHEKAAGPGGKDVRVWSVRADGETFTAQAS